MSTYKIHNRSVNHSHCPIVEASKFIGDFWNIWIIRVLLTGPKRFSEITTEIETINKATLTHKLKILIDAELIEKVLDSNLKPQYQLTKSGKKMKKLISELECFAQNHFEK